MPIFLFTDIEGSTHKWEKFPEEMKKILARHDAIISEKVGQFGGQIIKHTGDGVFVIFEEGEPLRCVIAIQKQFENEKWEPIGDLRIRIGMHSGYAEKREKDFFGPVINRAARIMGTAWGGQIVLSAEAANSTRLPENAVLKDLGAHLLKDLGEPQRLFQLLHPDLKLQEFPTLHSLSAHPNNLPVQATPFLGREEELAEVTKTLMDPSCRLLTLIGPGGIGKTRLSIQAAAEVIEYFPNGVFFVALAPLSSADFLISTIASVVRFTFYSQGEEKEQLMDYFSNKELLLVMDNFEHVTQGANIVAEILKSAPKVRILITSRELLSLQGEWVLQVKGLEVPEKEKVNIEGYSAVQLFLYNARRVNADITLSDDDKRYMIRICQLVGGLPLGIELASAWLRALSCKEIAQEIERNFDFLETTMRDVPERHRSLRAVFEYSWTLLSEREKEALRKLAVFRGGFSRRVAEKIAGATLPVISSLMDKSLLRKSASGRFEMLEILQQYAQQKLNENADEKHGVTAAHAMFFADFLNQREPHTIGPRQKETFDEIAEEIENIRLAWFNGLELNLNAAIERSINALFRFYLIHRSIREGEEIFSQAASHFEKSDTRLYARLLARCGSFATSVKNLQQARAIINKSLSLLQEYGLNDEIALVKDELGTIYHLLGENQEAETYLRQSLEIYEANNNRYGMAIALNNLGTVIDSSGNTEEGMKIFQSSLKIFQEIGDKRGIADCLNHLGNSTESLGKFEEAKKLYEESLTLCREINNRWGVARGLNNLANISATMGHLAEARKSYEESLNIFTEYGSYRGIASALTNIGIICRRLGDYGEARKKNEEALAIWKQIEYPLGMAASLNNIGALALTMGDFVEAKRYYNEGLEICRRIGDKWFVAVALENLGDICTQSKEYQTAQTYLSEALQLVIELQAEHLGITVLIGIAELMAAQANIIKAAEILAFVSNQTIADKDIREKAERAYEKIKKLIPRHRLDQIQIAIKNKSIHDMYRNALAV